MSEHACVHEEAPRRCNPCMLYISPLWTLSWEKPLPLPTRIYKPMETLLHNIAIDVATCESIERNLRGKAAAAKINLRKNATPRDVKEVVQTCVEACRKSRKRYHEENGPGPDTSDEALSQYTRFTDHSALHVYRQFLWYAPRLVNVVTLAEAIPMPGSGISLPLNLGLIASLCKGSYYAPKRFAAACLGPLRLVYFRLLTYPRARRRCNWRTATRGAACLCFVRRWARIQRPSFANTAPELRRGIEACYRNKLT